MKSYGNAIRMNIFGRSLTYLKIMSAQLWLPRPCFTQSVRRGKISFRKRWNSLCRYINSSLIFQRIFSFFPLSIQVLTAPNADPRQKDGALHMVGSLADILLKKPLYKSQMEQLLAQFVFPEFSSPHGHLRARACWVLQHFCNIKFNEETILAEAINLTQRSLLTDSELPVKVSMIIRVSVPFFFMNLR